MLFNPFTVFCVVKYAIGQNTEFKPDADWLSVTTETEICHDVTGLAEQTDYRFRVALFVRSEEFDYEQLDLSSPSLASTSCSKNSTLLPHVIYILTSSLLPWASAGFFPEGGRIF